jgi:PST family polysaccharide transporter
LTDTNRLISNFLSLSSIQVANYILPLITVPYLVRVLGPERYGLISFSQAFISYFSLLTDYGFNLSATREISIYRDNKGKLSEIFVAVITIKSIFMLASFLLLCSIIFSFQKFRYEWLLYLITFGLVIGNVLFPSWFLRGIERMKDIAIFNILTKILYTLSVFLFIHSKNDYLILSILNSMSFIIPSIAAFFIIIKQSGIHIKRPSMTEIIYQLKEGWHVFISTIAISLYTTSNTFILGVFTNNTIVGYYSAGEKIIRAALNLLGPLSQTIYPHISKLAAESRDAALNFIRKIIKIVGSVTFIFSVFILIFSSFISNLILGYQYKESISVIRILSFLPFIVGLSNIFGIQIMLNFGMKKIFMRILLIASILNLFLAIIFVKILEHIGISFSFLITEIFITSCMAYVLKKNDFRLFSFRISKVISH